MRENKWVFMIVGIFLGMLFVGISVTLVFQIIDVPVYPNLSRSSSTDFRFVIDNCLYSSTYGSGIRIHKDGSYYSRDNYEDIEDWYKQFEWDNFNLKGAGFGVFKQSYQEIGNLRIQTWRRAQHFEKPGVTHIQTDSHLDFCWSDKTTE